MPSSDRVTLERTARRTKLGFAALGILAAALVTIGIMLASDPAKTPFVIGAGILGSLVASILMLLVTELLLGPSRDDQAAHAERLDEALTTAARRLGEALTTIDLAFPLVTQATLHGVAAVKPKSSYSQDEWSGVLRDAHERLILVGHALDKWCEEDIRELFEDTLDSLARSGKTVQLLTLPAEGANTARISDQRGGSYSRRIRTTLEVVAGVYHRLPPECREALCVRALSEDVDMPYMLVANESMVITCAYPTTSRRSDSMLTTTADPSKPCGQAIREDFNQLWERYGVPVALPHPDS